MDLQYLISYIRNSYEILYLMYKKFDLSGLDIAENVKLCSFMNFFNSVKSSDKYLRIITFFTINLDFLHYFNLILNYINIKYGGNSQD